MTRRFLLGFVAPVLFLIAIAPGSEIENQNAGLLVPLIIVFILILINGFFVAAEFAIIGVRSSQIDQMVQEGKRGANRVQSILDSSSLQDRYIATAQLGITIASLGLGMYGEPRIAAYIEPGLEALFGEEVDVVLLHTFGSIITVAFLTYLHVVVGEMVPKSIALATPDRAVLSLSQPMHVAQVVLHWPVSILNNIGRWILKIIKIPPAEGHARLHSPEEIELIVTESAEGGLLLEEEEEMIRNIFEFSDRQVGQIMTPRTKVQSIPIDIDSAELLKQVTISRHSRFPVYENDSDHVVGILHLKDLVRQQIHEKGQIDLRRLLRPAPAVPEDHQVERLLSAFKRQRIHMAIVIDEFGGLAGIVTLEDLVEEIVGEVRDEFDLEKEPIIELGPGAFEIAGSYLVDDLSELVFLGDAEDLPDVETVGGLIHTWLGRPPQVGDKVIAEKNTNLTLTVLDIDGLAVARAKVEFPVILEEENGE